MIMGKNKLKTSKLTILVSLVILLVVINVLFIALVSSEAKTVELLKKELTDLYGQEKIIATASELSQSYKEEIEVISAVFPTEQTITTFIQTIEENLKGVTNEYTFRFSSPSPVREQDKLYLPLTITVKTDMAGLTRLLEEFENLPYMTHITSVTTRSPDGFSGGSEVTLLMKVYVQNPFTNI